MPLHEMTMALFRKLPDSREGRISCTSFTERDSIAALACIRISPPDQLGASCSLRNEAKFQLSLGRLPGGELL
jgi:hypothetical protein